MAILDLFRLDGKRALVTGGSRGLGRAIAQALAEAGADLVIVGRDAASLNQARGELVALGRKVDTIVADLTTGEEAERLCDLVLANHSPIDILINNVGGRRENVPTEEMSVDTWRKLVDLNLTSVFVCTKRIGGAMLKRGWGRVINIGSIAGDVAMRDIHGRHYETAKAAVSGFTRSVAADWATTGVTVNAIAPGGFLTDANRRWFGERPEWQKVIESRIPMGRLGEPDELGGLAVYLASDASRYMTGAILVIDGGYTLW
jgi:gluconate 5-dehydrogenase